MTRNVKKLTTSEIRGDGVALAPVVVALADRLLAHAVAAAVVLHGSPSAGVAEDARQVIAETCLAGPGCVVLLDLDLGADEGRGVKWAPTISQLRSLGARVVLVAGSGMSAAAVDAALAGAEGAFSPSQSLADLVDLLAGRPASWLRPA